MKIPRLQKDLLISGNSELEPKPHESWLVDFLLEHHSHCN